MKKLFGIIGVLSVVLFGSWFTINAQQTQDDGLNIQISPLPINLEVDPGESVSTDIRVRNANNTSEKLKITLMKFSAKGDRGEAVLLDREPADTYFDWVSFSESEFEAMPNEWKSVKMTIDVPEAAAFGYYYAVLISRADDPVPEPGKPAISGHVAIFVLLAVDSPGAVKELDVTSFESARKIYEFLPAKFLVNVKNTGNIHISPSGNIFINKNDKQIDTLILNPGFGNILPQTNKLFELDWGNGFPKYTQKLENGSVVVDKDGNIKKDLRWDWQDLNNIRIGKYTANLFLVYDDGVRAVPVEGTLEFWVMPWRILAVALIVGIALLYGSFVLFRSIYRKLFHKE
jgi:hypothetical protein